MCNVIIINLHDHSIPYIRHLVLEIQSSHLIFVLQKLLSYVTAAIFCRIFEKCNLLSKEIIMCNVS